MGLIANVAFVDAGGGGEVRPAVDRTVRAVVSREVGLALQVRGMGVRRLMNRGGGRVGLEEAKLRHIVVTKNTGSRGGTVRKNRTQGVVRRIGWISRGGWLLGGCLLGSGVEGW